MSDTVKDFEKIYNQITTPKFLSMQSIGGEEPFFIYSFDPKEQNLVKEETLRLKKRVEQSGYSVLLINLFDIAIDLLEQRGMLDKVLEKEPTIPKKKLLQTLQNMLDVETKIVPYIKRVVDENQTSMLFLEGVGEVYPFIRSHTVINNLQKAVSDRPILMFFPGTFDGYRLILFNRIYDDNHYRAFNIVNYNF